MYDDDDDVYMNKCLSLIDFKQVMSVYAFI